MKPVISYYGGKQKLSMRLKTLIPQHTVYVEPFAGGAALMFMKPWPEVTDRTHYREVLNDKDERIINFYRILQTRGEELVTRLSFTLYSEAEYKRSAAILRAFPDADPLDAAWAYYVNIQQSFAKRLHGGWGRGVYSRNSATTWCKKVAGLREYLTRMAAVHISCQDALTILSHWDSPQTFFYCDPPYPGTYQGHYSGYSVDDFQNLVSALDKVNGSFMLSCYDFEGITVPADWERFTFQTYCSGSGKGKVNADRSRKATSEELSDRKRTEVVYRRFNKVPPRIEIQKLYNSGAYDCFVKHPEFSNQKQVLF